jgi:hypothetical protein
LGEFTSEGDFLIEFGFHREVLCKGLSYRSILISCGAMYPNSSSGLAKGSIVKLH